MVGAGEYLEIWNKDEWTKIEAVLDASFAEIAEETGIKEGTIRQTVNRKKNGMFTVIEGSNGLQKVALLETRRAS